MNPDSISTQAEVDEFFRLAGLRLESHRRYARRSVCDRLGLDNAAVCGRALTHRPPLDPAAYVGLALGRLAALDPTGYEQQLNRAGRWLDGNVGSAVQDARSRGRWMPISALLVLAVRSHFRLAAEGDHSMLFDMVAAAASQSSDPLRALGCQAILEALVPQCAIRADVFATAVVRRGHRLRSVGYEYRLEMLVPRRAIDIPADRADKARRWQA